MSTDSLPTRCKCRKQAVTSLRCSRCYVPICPDCSKPAPVGMLCRQCASPRNIALFQVSAGQIGAAFGAALIVGVLVGWLLVSVGMGFGFFALWGAILYGGLIAEVALRVTGRKRGLEMEIVAGICAGLGILGGWFLDMLRYQAPDGAGPALLFPTSPWFYAMAVLAVMAAVGRIRYM